MSYNASTTPPFVVFQKPIFRFKTHGGPVGVREGKTSASGTAANGCKNGGSVEGAPNIVASRIYIDEVANDVVIFSDNSREVCFYQLLLHEEEEEGAADRIETSLDQPGDQKHQQKRFTEEEKWLRHHPMLCGDAVSFRIVPKSSDDQSVIHHAKRCPIPVCSNATGPAHLIAVSLNTDAVFFFLCHLQMQGENKWENSLIATYQCKPRNLRFRKGFYPVCAFYWVENVWGDRGDNGSQAPYRGLLLTPFTASDPHRQQRCATKSSESATPSTRRILCITSISIDLLGIPYGAKSVENKDGWVLLCRYTTHTDYWHYCPAAMAILSINMLKPWHVKVFELQGEQGLRRLPSLRLEENFLAAEGERETTASSLLPAAACMNTPPVRYPVVLLALYQQLFVCSLSRRSGGVTLFRYVPSADDGKSGGVSSFTMHAVLRTDFQLHMRREPIALQVIDNLVVLHAPRLGVSTAFDILHCEEDWEEDANHDCSWHTNASGARGSVGESEMQRRSGVISSDTISSGEGNNQAGRRMFTQSSWFSWLANRVRNSCVRKGRICMCDDASGAEVAVPVMQPLLSAALSLHPGERVDKFNPISCEDNEIYNLDFISGALPLLLNRRSGAVCLVGVNPFALAAVMSQPCQRVQFYLNRMYCAGKAVHSLVYDMLLRRKHLSAVGRTFELITAHHAAHHHLRAPCGIKGPRTSTSTLHEATVRGTPGRDTYSLMPQQEFSRTALLTGNLTALCHWLPEEDTDGPLPYCPPWRCRSSLTIQDILAACTSSHASTHRRDVSLLEESVGQVGLERDVFTPLVDAAMRHMREGTQTYAGDAMDAGSLASTSGSASAHLCFCRYLFYALLEYARCVVGTGVTLIGGLQQDLMRLFPYVADGCGPLRHFLRSTVITDQLPMALLFLDMGEEWWQMGMDTLVRLRADDKIVEVLLQEKRLVEAAKYLYSVVSHSQQGLGPTERLIHARLMGDIFRSSLKIVEEEEEESTLRIIGTNPHAKDGQCGGGNGNVVAGRGRRGRKAIEFMAVYEIIIGCLLRQPHFDEAVPQQLVPATAKYRQLLAEGGVNAV